MAAEAVIFGRVSTGDPPSPPPPPPHPPPPPEMGNTHPGRKPHDRNNKSTGVGRLRARTRLVHAPAAVSRRKLGVHEVDGGQGGPHHGVLVHAVQLHRRQRLGLGRATRNPLRLAAVHGIVSSGRHAGPCSRAVVLHVGHGEGLRRQGGGRQERHAAGRGSTPGAGRGLPAEAGRVCV
jgi:hypothetical protein